MADTAAESNTGGDQTPEEALRDKKGAFAASVLRSNKQIRYDRGLMLVEKTEKHYRRTVEDLSDKINDLKRERDAALDLSPTNAQSLVLSADFNEQEFTDSDIKLGVEIRNTEIKHEVALKRYEVLFGPFKRG